ncbi:P-loop containing nucleoside triphosphate hydrolase [Pyrrhoderma noxium]|uniref:P-loop containing nucleoside triphosphate hydrolase n=1 Tax=Pyrrhoderma noxium TaxID=2282107 RepID=A0A286UMJ4_9AGAM|nr:P-loop containing nucleoside triphosphate hydrolase [Pyrrhoderma noxium]
MSLSEDQTTWPVHVEVRLLERTSKSFESVRQLVYHYITENYETIFMPTVLKDWEVVQALKSSVEKIVISDSVCSHQSLPIGRCSLQIHVYQPIGCTYERMSMNPSDPSEEYTAGTISELPSKEIDGLWDSLFYEGDVKTRLLNYIQATIGFSDADVDHNLVSWNRVILLHGPPGTGKTSLCRALAQKLSIRLKERYTKTHLFEINSHSLFSRWFSESGKLVQNLFSTVGDMAKEDDEFIVLLIDEVESLTSARAGVMSGTEPSDALRVVNALLTQIDRLKYQKNVLIMATSNLAKAIDSAFVDRADIAEYIDYPPAGAIYGILRSSLVELMEKNIVEKLVVPTMESAILAHRIRSGNTVSEEQDPVKTMYQLSLGSTTDSQELGSRLYAIAEKCRGTSGRSLRRLPVLAHARYIGLMPVKTKGVSKPNGQTGPNSASRSQPISVGVWLAAMQKVVDDESFNRQRFQ